MVRSFSDVSSRAVPSTPISSLFRSRFSSTVSLKSPSARFFSRPTILPMGEEIERAKKEKTIPPAASPATMMAKMERSRSRYATWLWLTFFVSSTTAAISGSTLWMASRMAPCSPSFSVSPICFCRSR